jgi:hypothetical protein
MAARVAYYMRKTCAIILPWSKATGHECDVLGVTTDGMLIDVELKISRGDFSLDQNKQKWWCTLPSEQGCDGRDLADMRQWPPQAWKHYYVLPAHIWRKRMLEGMPSPRSGVVLIYETGNRGVTGEIVHAAQPNPDAQPVSVEFALELARVASSRMWENYAGNGPGASLRYYMLERKYKDAVEDSAAEDILW